MQSGSQIVRVKNAAGLSSCAPVFELALFENSVTRLYHRFLDERADGSCSAHGIFHTVSQQKA